MNTSKHTPGPWVVTPNHAESVEGERLNITVGDQLIAEIHHAWIDWDEYDANAHLIAAAPAMYEALRDCVGRLEAYYGDTYPAVIRGKQALAQAEGK